MYIKIYIDTPIESRNHEQWRIRKEYITIVMNLLTETISSVEIFSVKSRIIRLRVITTSMLTRRRSDISATRRERTPILEEISFVGDIYFELDSSRSIKLVRCVSANKHTPNDNRAATPLLVLELAREKIAHLKIGHSIFYVLRNEVKITKVSEFIH